MNDTKLREAVRRAYKKVKRARAASLTRFSERHVLEMEDQLRPCDQIWFFRHIKFMEVEGTKKVESQDIHNKHGRRKYNKARCARFFNSLLNVNAEKLNSDSSTSPIPI